MKKLAKIIESIANKEELPENLVLSALEESISKGLGKKYKPYSIKTKINDDFEVEIYKVFKIIDDEMTLIEEGTFSNYKHIFKDTATEKYNVSEEDAIVGSDILIKINDTPENKRSYFKIANQYFYNKIRELKVKKLETEMFDEDEAFFVKVSSFNKLGYIVQFKEYEGLLPFANLNEKNERLKINEKYLVSIDLKSENKNMIQFTRKGENFIKAVFGKEIPEIHNEVVSISNLYVADKKIFVMVKTSDKRTDAVAACVGPKGHRINTIRSLIGNPSIELIEDKSNQMSKEDFEAYIISQVLNKKDDINMQIILEKNKTTLIIIDDEKYQKNEYNQKVIEKFASTKIIIKTKEEFEMDCESSANHLVKELDLDEESAKFCCLSGLKKIEEIAMYDPEELDEYLMLGNIDVAEQFVDRAKSAMERINMIVNLEGKELLELKTLSKEAIYLLIQDNIKTVDDLADLSSFELVAITNIDKLEADKIIMSARGL